MTAELIESIVCAMLPDKWRCDCPPHVDGLSMLTITNEDGKPRWSYIGEDDSEALVKATGIRVIKALGGTPCKEDEKK